MGKPEGHFVQILNLSGNHWATVSNINCPKDTVAVYDSMNNSPPKAGKKELLKQLACFVVPKKTLKIEWVDIQKRLVCMIVDSLPEQLRHPCVLVSRLRIVTGNRTIYGSMS